MRGGLKVKRYIILIHRLRHIHSERSSVFSSRILYEYSNSNSVFNVFKYINILV